jgi:hypothetical protein
MTSELYKALLAAGVDEVLAREAAESVLPRQRTSTEIAVTLENRRVRAEERARRLRMWTWVLVIAGAIVNAIIGVACPWPRV